MQQQNNIGALSIYAPANSMNRLSIIFQHLGRLPVIRREQPEHICGIARRIGFIKKHKKRLALYQLKLYQNDWCAIGNVLPELFIVKEGIFVAYSR